MLHALCAHTFEIDEPELAVKELLEQLDLEHTQLRHSVGLLCCYPEYITSGVVDALCEALPFDVIGATTLGNSVNGTSGSLMLALTVLTSDTVVFSTVSTGSLSETQEAPMEEAYLKARQALGGEPSLILTYAPMIRHVGGELLVSALDKACGGIPIFGTIACDNHIEYIDARCIHNGPCEKDSLAMVLLRGDISPQFFTGVIPDIKVQQERALITKSQANLLMEVNGIPFLEHMKTLGLSDGKDIESVNTIPLMVDYQDGSRLAARAMYMISPQGHIVCGAAMPTGCTLAIASIDYEDVLHTSKETVNAALQCPQKQVMLLFPCLSRFLILEADFEAEMSAVNEAIAGVVPYQMCYAGGEICPVYDGSGKLVNRFHNYSIVACAL